MSFHGSGDRAADILAKVAYDQKRGNPRALFAACTANRMALRAVLHQAKKSGLPALIESTASQVNSYGGYTGQTPERFAGMVRQIAAEMDLSPDRIILGGDHIGPYPWRREKAGPALLKARSLVAACVKAGYRKIHLDATVPCADDPCQADGTLPIEVISRRTADLCLEAESSARHVGSAPPWYVIGSDVPSPGGSGMPTKATQVSDRELVRESVAAARRAFQSCGLEAAWLRVLAIVVQTGAEFSPQAVQPYDPMRVASLKAYIQQEKRLVFEAHSTDFQAPAALRAMVLDQFAILKVGPSLTYTLRKALFALADVEKDALQGRKSMSCSRLPEVMEDLMVAEPAHWTSYYQGTEETVRYLRQHAYSDRIRYYWARPEAQSALKQLMTNLKLVPPPPALIQRYLPEVWDKIDDGRLPNDPDSIVLDQIGRVTAMYARACQPVPA